MSINWNGIGLSENGIYCTATIHKGWRREAYTAEVFRRRRGEDLNVWGWRIRRSSGMVIEGTCKTLEEARRDSEAALMVAVA